MIIYHGCIVTLYPIIGVYPIDTMLIDDFLDTHGWWIAANDSYVCFLMLINGFSVIYLTADSWLILFPIDSLTMALRSITTET